MTTNNMSCPLCSNLSSLELAYENDVAAVALHDDWAVRGHAMVIAKRHVENLCELAEPERFMRVYREAERVLLRLTGAERAIIVKLGIATPHLHVHVYPMRASDSRKHVFEAIEGGRREGRDEGFVARVTELLSC